MLFFLLFPSEKDHLWRKESLSWRPDYFKELLTSPRFLNFYVSVAIFSHLKQWFVIPLVPLTSFGQRNMYTDSYLPSGSIVVSIIFNTMIFFFLNVLCLYYSPFKHFGWTCSAIEWNSFSLVTFRKFCNTTCCHFDKKIVFSFYGNWSSRLDGKLHPKRTLCLNA